MLRYILLMVMLVGWTASTTFAQCRLEILSDPQGREILHLNNGLIQAQLLPASSGRVMGLGLVKESVVLTPPLHERVVEEPLLPRMVTNNQAGFKDWLWGETNRAENLFVYRLIENNTNRIVVDLEGRVGYFRIVRRVQLDAGSLVLRQQVTITNPTAQQQKLNYWAHLVLDGDQFIDNAESDCSTIYVPADRGHATPRNRKMLALDRSGVQPWVMKKGSALFEPMALWQARFISPASTGVAMRMSSTMMGPDAMLYTWQGNGFGGPLVVTLEMIADERILQSKASITFDVALILLPGMTGIDALHDVHAVQQVKGQWQVLAIENTPATSLSIKQDSKSMVLKVPAMKAGEHWMPVPNPTLVN